MGHKKAAIWYIFLPVGLLLSTALFYLLDINCFVRTFFHIPCPTCGMTRAFFALARLDFPGAFYYHPMVFVIVPLAAFSLLQHKKPLSRLPKWLRILLLSAGWGAFIAVYLIRLHLDIIP